MWKKRLVVNIFKKGSLHEYNNCRGVTLLPLISKISCRMRLARIKKGMDRKRRKEQAGFWPKGKISEQILILENILGQANESRMGLYAHFVDFEKPFDSVQSERLWNIMRSYEIADKMVRVIEGIYAGFERTVVDGSVTSD